MKALIAAGGKATRLRPITSTINKHLIPLAGRPMIFLAIEKLTEAGVRDIAINVNPGDTSIAQAVGDGSRWGARIAYIEQSGGARGIAHAVANARDFLGDEPFVFYLGDNIILGSIRRFVERFESEGLDCMLALARVRDPQRFGVPEIVGDRIVKVEEKPAEPKSDYAVTGIYVYTKEFFEAFSQIVPSARGEYEISDVNSRLIANGRKVGWEEITGWWKDTGKPEDLLEGDRLHLDELFAGDPTKHGFALRAGADGRMNVAVGEGATIGEGVTLVGPAIIGARDVVVGATVGPYVSLGADVTVKGASLSRSIVMDGTRIECARKITDSLIGSNVTVSSADASGGDHRMIVGENSKVEI